MDNTIQGAGNVGWSGAPTPITNQHEIIANLPTPMLVTSPDFVNEGLLLATAGAEMRLAGTPLDNTLGVIRAEDASLVTFNNAVTVTGGLLESTGTGLFETSGTNTFVDVTTTAPIRIANGSALLGTNTLVNENVITIDSAGSATYLRAADGPLTLTGGGTIRMSDHPQNWIYRQNVGGEIINVDNTIHGAGNIGWVGSPTPITNQHEIIADGTNPLLISSPDLLNEGLLKAEGGSEMQFASSTIDNTAGVIRAEDGGTLRFGASNTLTGGTVEALGSAMTLCASVNTFEDVTFSGDVRVLNGQVLRGVNTLVNQGTITLDSTGSSTYLRMVGAPLTLSGGGTVEMLDSVSTWIYRDTVGGALINVDNTIRGAGNLGWVGSPTPITNQAGGVIESSGVNPMTLTGAPFLNEGLLTITGTGGITSPGGAFTNAGTVMIPSGTTFARILDYAQTGGTTTVDGLLDLGIYSLELQGGILEGSGLVDGDVNATGGAIAPGASAGELMIGEELFVTDGLYDVEIGGLMPGSEHDQLNVLGTATLGGEIRVAAIDGFEPQIGDSFVVLTANPVVGTFHCEDLQHPANGFWSVTYGEFEVTVELVKTKNVFAPEDLNRDGAVNISDLLALLADWGACTGACCPADFNGDGSVTVVDLLQLLAAWT